MKEGEERIYTIPLGDSRKAPRNRRAKRAIRIIREFVRRHAKASEVKIDGAVNEFVWSRGIQKPPRRVRVRVVMGEGGVATVHLAQ